MIISPRMCLLGTKRTDDDDDDDDDDDSDDDDVEGY